MGLESEIDMFVLTQNRRNIVDITGLMIAVEYERDAFCVCGYSPEGGTRTLLGEYASNEAAKLALKGILGAIENGKATYEMPIV